MHQSATRMRYQHFSFFNARMSLSLSKIISGRSSARSGIRDEYKVLRLSSFNIHRSFGQTFGIPRMAPSFSRDAHSHFLSLFLPLCSSPSFSSSFSPSTFPVQPPPVYVRGSKRITASSRRLMLGNNHHGPNVLSSPPVNQVNPINALGRSQTKKSPPGTLAPE